MEESKNPHINSLIKTRFGAGQDPKVQVAIWVSVKKIAKRVNAIVWDKWRNKVMIYQSTETLLKSYRWKSEVSKKKR